APSAADADVDATPGRDRELEMLARRGADLARSERILADARARTRLGRRGHGGPRAHQRAPLRAPSDEHARRRRAGPRVARPATARLPGVATPGFAAFARRAHRSRAGRRRRARRCGARGARRVARAPRPRLVTRIRGEPLTS